jgi:hypothetical protein
VAVYANAAISGRWLPSGLAPPQGVGHRWEQKWEQIVFPVACFGDPWLFVSTRNLAPEQGFRVIKRNAKSAD